MIGIDVLDEGGFAEKKPDATQIIEIRPEFVVGKDGEIGGNEIDVGSRLELRTQKITYSAAAVVIANPRSAKRLVGHGLQR